MHLYQLPVALRSALLSTAIAPMRVIAQFSAYTKVVIGTTPAGDPIFSAGYPLSVWLDVDRLSNAPVTLNRSKPILPSDGQSENLPMASEVQLQFNNHDSYFAATQIGAIFDPARIEQAEVMLYLQVGEDVATRMPIYRGRVIGLPEETAGTTTITIRDSLYGVIREPVLFEKFSPNQQTQVVGQGAAATLQNGTASIGPVGDTVTYYDGIVSWTEDGQPLTSVSNSKPDDVQFTKVVISNGALTGKYTLEFQDASTYRVIYPDNEILTGNVATDYPGVGITNHTISIPASAWIVTGVPTDAKIEFFVSATFRGNPVTAIMNLVEKGLTKAWGTQPTFSNALPVDWAAFTAARAYFNNWHVFVDVTNEDNKVWSKRKGAKPLSCLQLAQRIADHIGCQIMIDNYGLISISVPGIFANPDLVMRDNGQQPAVIACTIDAQERSNWIKINYGFSNINESFSSHRIIDNRPHPNDEITEYVVNLPFYKQSVSTYEVQRLGQLLSDRILKSFTRLTLKVKPNWGVAFVPGDRFRLITSEAPRVDMYVEVYRCDITIGGEVVLGCIRIAAPTEEFASFCTAVFCEAKFG